LDLADIRRHFRQNNQSARRKLEVDPSAPRVIQIERGIGYFFALSVEPF
jgi:DNA-binding response OmpR family regulator